MNTNLVFRTGVMESDSLAIREITESTGFFYDFEVDVAVELINERLAKGEQSGYYFVIAEIDDKPVAYTCFGPVPVTIGSFDLYWIVTHNDYRNKGIGKKILEQTYTLIRAMNGRAVYAETSGKAKYADTRAFYEKCNYTLDALQHDFYDVGDDKYVYKYKL